MQNAIDQLRQDLAAQRPAIEFGTVVRYLKRFTPGGEEYTYAAVFIGQWYTTTKRAVHQGVFEHDEFIRELSSPEVISVDVADSFTSLTSERGQQESNRVAEQFGPAHLRRDS